MPDSLKIDKEQEEQKDTVGKISVTNNSINVPAPVRVTFIEIGSEWLKEYSSRLNKSDEEEGLSLSYSSVDSRDLSFRKICEYIGDMFIDEINQGTAFNIIELCRYKPDGTEYSFSYMDKLQQTNAVKTSFPRLGRTPYAKNIYKKENVTHYLLCYIFLTPYISESGIIT